MSHHFQKVGNTAGTPVFVRQYLCADKFPWSLWKCGPGFPAQPWDFSTVYTVHWHNYAWFYEVWCRKVRSVWRCAVWPGTRYFCPAVRRKQVRQSGFQWISRYRRGCHRQQKQSVFYPLFHGSWLYVHRNRCLRYSYYKALTPWHGSIDSPYDKFVPEILDRIQQTENLVVFEVFHFLLFDSWSINSCQRIGCNSPLGIQEAVKRTERWYYPWNVFGLYVRIEETNERKSVIITGVTSTSVSSRAFSKSFQ